MDELRRIRKERGLSQQRLADLAGVDKVTIVHIEGGKVSPKVETLEKLATALEVDLADLFPKAQAPLFRELPDPATQEERRVLWESTVKDARRLRETGRDRLEELLAAWYASKERGEDSGTRRAYLDEMGELLQRAYDAEMALLAALYEPRIAEQWPEVQVADRFYVQLWRLVQGAGLSIYTGADAVARSSISVGLEGPPARTSTEPAPHTVKEPEAA